MSNQTYKSDQSLMQFLLAELDNGVVVPTHTSELLTGYFRENIIAQPDVIAKQVVDVLLTTSKRLEEYKLSLQSQNKILEKNAFELKEANRKLEEEIQRQRKVLHKLRNTAALLAGYSGKHIDTIGTNPEMLTEMVEHLIQSREQDRLALAESQHQYSSLVEHMGQIVFQTDSQGKFRFLNSAWSSITGYPVMESVGRNITEFVHADDTHKEKQLVSILCQNGLSQFNSLNKGKNYKSLLRIRIKNGDIRFLEINRQMRFDNYGNHIGLSGTMQDVTQQHLASEKIKELKDFYETILNNLPSDIAVLDSEHRYVYVNPVAVADPEIRRWMIGKNNFEYCNKRGRNEGMALQREEIFNRAVQDQCIVEWEDSLISPEKIDYKLRRMAPIFNEDKKLQFVIAYGLDITERKKAEKQLASVASRLSALINNLQSGILVQDENCKIALTNNFYCSMFNLTGNMDDIIGMDCSIAVENSKYNFLEPESFVKRVKKLLKDKQPVLQEVLELADGRIFERDFIPIFDDNKTYLGNLWQFRDITERLRMEKQLKEAKNSAESSLKAKEQFLANMSHEIRTPMNAILGMSNLLLKTKLSHKQDQYLEAIHNSSKNLLVIINDILDFSKIEAGKLELEKVGFKMKKLISSSLDTFLYAAAEKSLTMQYEITGLDEPVLIGDPVRISQVIINLVSNSIKFTEKGGVKIMVKKKQEFENKIVVEFSVSDTGIGIPEDIIPNIYDSFTQADVGISRKYGGTGLGLTISKKLVELQGGTIQIKSQVKKGTTISFELVFEKGTLHELPEENVQDNLKCPVQSVRVLLAEDHEYNQVYAVSLLTDWGFQVDVANDGKEAIEMLKKNAYEIVLMDIQMPVMSGLDATQHIREELPDPIRNIPIIAMTANAIKGDNEKYLEAGMNDYIAKPFDPEKLFNKMQNLINKQKGIKTEPEVTDSKNTLEAPIDFSDTEPLVDLAFLQKMSRGNKIFVMNMINLFFDTSKPLIEQIRRSHKNGETEKVRKTIHKMKPSIDSMGMRALKSLFIRIERSIDQKQSLKHVDKMLSDSYSLYDKCEAALRHAQQQMEVASEH